MIGYTTVWTNDFEKAVSFYDDLLWEIWAKRFIEMDRFVAWSQWDNTPGFAVAKPYNNESASAWNWTMTAFSVESNDKVDKIYAQAIKLGWTDEGRPWLRWNWGFYAWYFRDLDGNKINFFHLNKK